MVLALIVLAVVLVVAVVGLLAVREVRTFRAADRDRPAVLEGGGSHLQRPRRR